MTAVARQPQHRSPPPPVVPASGAAGGAQTNAATALAAHHPGNPRVILPARVADDEMDLLGAVFSDDDITCAAEFSRCAGIATLLLTVNFTFPGAGVVPIVLRLTSTTSGPLGTPQTEFAAPVFDEKASAGLSIATVRDLTTAVAETATEGGMLVGEPATLEPAGRDWVFSSSGWLLGLVTAVKEILNNDGRLGSRDSSAMLLGDMHQRTGSVVGTDSGGGEPATVPEALLQLPPSTEVVVTSRVYRLEHMRRPVDYIRTLHSWLAAAAFNGQHGFVSCVVATESKHPKVYVGVMHLDATTPEQASAAATAAGSDVTAMAKALGDFGTFERMWRTVTVDVDKQGRPCHERLNRVAIDVAQRVPARGLAHALHGTPLRTAALGECDLAVIGMPYPSVKTSPYGECPDRTSIDAAFLRGVGLADAVDVQAANAGYTSSGSGRGAGPATPGAKLGCSTLSPERVNTPFTVFAKEVCDGNIWS